MPLRDVLESDLPILFEHQRDPAAGHMAAFPARAWDAFVTHWRVKVLGDATAGKKAILVGGAVAGHVGSWNQEGKRLVGYWIGRDHWGRGVATAALSEYLQLETLRPLHAHVAAHNVGSIRVLEKSGFGRVEEGQSPPDGVEELLFRLDR